VPSEAIQPTGYPEPDIELAAKLFDQLAQATRQGRGIRRDSYGAGEQAAHDIVRRAGEFLNLEVHSDAALNLYLTLPGRDRAAASVIIGSHLDSVDQGGNYDGAAGVLAGLAVLAGFRRAEITPVCDVSVMAIRCEEAAWFDCTYVGSYAAFGEVPLDELKVLHAESGRSLGEHMLAAGCNLDALTAGETYLDSGRIRAFIEPHIEQAPTLVHRDLPVGIVTGVRGVLRHREASCVGEYGHSGALSRGQRHDAVAATVALIQRLNDEWLRREKMGEDLVFTVGELTTDPAYHGPSKVAGETRFVLDFRSTSEEVMRAMSDLAHRVARRIETETGVTFDLGRASYSEPGEMDPLMRRRMTETAQAIGVSAVEMPSGAGHDAVVFANFGVPTGMIFIRNRHGSHNPEEAMDLADFEAACRLLSAYLADSLK
jgi:N-carbamoyl-L-amino-acid hydrolase